MNIFELIMWSLILWMLSWTTIAITNASELPLVVVSFFTAAGVFAIVGIINRFVPRRRKQHQVQPSESSEAKPSD
ncbi:MAG: hypothetical protein JKY96_08760 [Phycisphaerales bacterium]|nr:hypothetical protein [Phycisphaerales bacterium]